MHLTIKKQEVATHHIFLWCWPPNKEWSMIWVYILAMGVLGQIFTSLAFFVLFQQLLEHEKTRFSHFSVAKATLELQMSVRPLVCLSVCPSSIAKIVPISQHTHQVFQPSSLLTMEPINHWAYRPSSISTIEPISHLDFFCNF